MRPPWVAIAAGAGAVGGAVGGALFPALSPALGALPAAALSGGASGPAGYLTHSGLSGTSVTWKGVLISAAVGAVAGVVLYGAASVIKPSSGTKLAGPVKPPKAGAGTPPPSTPAPGAVTGSAGTHAPGDPWPGTFGLPPKPQITPPSVAAPTPRAPPQPPRVNARDVPDHLCGEACMAARQASMARLPQDAAVSPVAPRGLPLGRSVGRASHNRALQTDIANLPKGATDIRVNQQQVNALGQRVGINRPDLQYTLNGRRYYVEYEGLANPRGAAHQARIQANDPNANFILRLIP